LISKPYIKEQTLALLVEVKDMEDEKEFFGEPISVYTEEQAIEDGVKADLGLIHFTFGNVRVTATTGFISEVKTLQAMHILLRTIENIHPKTPNMIVFQQGQAEDRREDERRTLITHMVIDKKVYAKLDDHGSHYVLTFMLAEEY